MEGLNPSLLSVVPGFNGEVLQLYLQNSVAKYLVFHKTGRNFASKIANGPIIAPLRGIFNG
jgi:hypothetical protein